MDRGVKPPTGRVIQGPAHHLAHSLCIPQQVGVAEVPAVVPCVFSFLFSHIIDWIICLNPEDEGF
jgi:hypothetical protein